MKNYLVILSFMTIFLISSCYSPAKQPTVKDKSDDAETFIPQGKSRRSLPKDETQSCSPYFFVKSDDPSKSWMPLHSTQAEVKITGAIANVRVEQIYINESKQKLDAIYVFPGSTRAAVYGLDMVIGSRVIQAKIMEKQKARNNFERARNEGKSATLLEQDRPNIFKMEVANILPGDTIKVDMFYTELLEYRDKEYEFVYPTAVGPRYDTSNNASVKQSIAQLSSGHSPKFDIQVTIDGAIPVQSVESSSHPIRVKHVSDTKTTIALSNAGDTKLKEDFILYYSLQGGKVESGLTLYEHGDEKFFLFMMQPPKTITPEEILPREYIFIVDVSGSMSGFPLEVSKTILKKLISSLKPTDRFNVLLFESSNSMLSQHSLPATQANINKAIAVIDNQEGGGGTELYPALQTAFSYKDPTLDGYARTFIIATDGYVTVESEAFKLISNNLSKANFVPLGIGGNVNRHLIEGMAWAGASEPFIINNQTKANEVGSHLIKTISQPLLSDISIDWGNMDVYDIYPTKVPNIFSERPIVVFGKYKGSANGAITIKGKTAEGAFNQQIAVAKATKSDNEALRYLWARNKIKYLSDYASCYENNNYIYNEEKNSNAEEVTQLGLKYNLLTKYTSFLAIDENRVDEIIMDEPTFSQYEEVNQAYASKSVVSYDQAMVINEEYESLPEIKTTAPVSMDEEENVVFTQTEQMPAYPGGDKAMMEYISSQLKYPATAKEQAIQGTVVLRFTVDENGNIADITILRSLDPSCDKEAIRILKSMPKWIPGKQGGKKVAVYYTLPVRFRLNS